MPGPGDLIGVSAAALAANVPAATVGVGELTAAVEGGTAALGAGTSAVERYAGSLGMGGGLGMSLSQVNNSLLAFNKTLYDQSRNLQFNRQEMLSYKEDLRRLSDDLQIFSRTSVGEMVGSLKESVITMRLSRQEIRGFLNDLKSEFKGDAPKAMQELLGVFERFPSVFEQYKRGARSLDPKTFREIFEAMGPGRARMTNRLFASMDQEVDKLRKVEQAYQRLQTQMENVRVEMADKFDDTLANSTAAIGGILKPVGALVGGLGAVDQKIGGAGSRLLLYMAIVKGSQLLYAQTHKLLGSETRQRQSNIQSINNETKALANNNAARSAGSGVYTGGPSRLWDPRKRGADGKFLPGGGWRDISPGPSAPAGMSWQPPERGADGRIVSGGKWVRDPFISVGSPKSVWNRDITDNAIGRGIKSGGRAVGSWLSSNQGDLMMGAAGAAVFGMAASGEISAQEQMGRDRYRSGLAGRGATGMNVPSALGSIGNMAAMGAMTGSMIPIPFVGPGVGALVGATVGLVASFGQLDGAVKEHAKTLAEDDIKRAYSSGRQYVGMTDRERYISRKEREFANNGASVAGGVEKEIIRLREEEASEETKWGIVKDLFFGGSGGWTWGAKEKHRLSREAAIDSMIKQLGDFARVEEQSEAKREAIRLGFGTKFTTARGEVDYKLEKWEIDYYAKLKEVQEQEMYVGRTKRYSSMMAQLGRARGQRYSTYSGQIQRQIGSNEQIQALYGNRIGSIEAKIARGENPSPYEQQILDSYYGAQSENVTLKRQAARAPYEERMAFTEVAAARLGVKSEVRAMSGAGLAETYSYREKEIEQRQKIVELSKQALEAEVKTKELDRNGPEYAQKVLEIERQSLEVARSKYALRMEMYDIDRQMMGYGASKASVSWALATMSGEISAAKGAEMSAAIQEKLAYEEYKSLGRQLSDPTVKLKPQDRERIENERKSKRIEMKSARQRMVIDPIEKSLAIEQYKMQGRMSGVDAQAAMGGNDLTIARQRAAIDISFSQITINKKKEELRALYASNNASQEFVSSIRAEIAAKEAAILVQKKSLSVLEGEIRTRRASIDLSYANLGLERSKLGGTMAERIRSYGDIANKASAVAIQKAQEAANPKLTYDEKKQKQFDADTAVFAAIQARKQYVSSPFDEKESNVNLQKGIVEAMKGYQEAINITLPPQMQIQYATEMKDFAAQVTKNAILKQEAMDRNPSLYSDEERLAQKAKIWMSKAEEARAINYPRRTWFESMQSEIINGAPSGSYTMPNSLSFNQKFGPGWYFTAPKDSSQRMQGSWAKKWEDATGLPSQYPKDRLMGMMAAGMNPETAIGKIAPAFSFKGGENTLQGATNKLGDVVETLREKIMNPIVNVYLDSTLIGNAVANKQAGGMKRKQ